MSKYFLTEIKTSKMLDFIKQIIMNKQNRNDDAQTSPNPIVTPTTDATTAAVPATETVEQTEATTTGTTTTETVDEVVSFEMLCAKFEQRLAETGNLDEEKAKAFAAICSNSLFSFEVIGEDATILDVRSGKVHEFKIKYS